MLTGAPPAAPAGAGEVAGRAGWPVAGVSTAGSGAVPAPEGARRHGEGHPQPGRPDLAAPAAGVAAAGTAGRLAGRLALRHGAGLVLAAAALWWLRAPVGTVVTLALEDRAYEHYSHAVLIPLLSVALILRDRGRIFAAPRTAPGWGGALLAAGVLLGILARRTPAEAAGGHTLALLGLAALWAGAFVLAYGVRAARAAAFPLGFLLLMVPLPPALLEGLVGLLLAGSTETTAWLFQALGVPVYRDGVVFALPGLTIEIAEQCSGIRSFVALVVTTLLAGHLLLRTAWARTALVLAILPIAIVKNAVRIVVLSLLAIHVHPGFITGGLLHRYGGIPLFATTLLVVGGVLWLLQRGEARLARARGA